jgi:hypothetical protein
MLEIIMVYILMTRQYRLLPLSIGSSIEDECEIESIGKKVLESETG